MNKDKVKKIYITAFLVFLALITFFYFFTGEQLKYRESEQNGKIVDADSVTGEIYRGIYIEQDFYNTLDKIESLSIVFTKNYQEGDGNLVIELHDGGLLLARDVIKVSDVPEQHRLYLQPINDIHFEKGNKLTLSIYTTSHIGSGIRVMSRTDYDASYMYNGETVKGTLCFATDGFEIISASSYYWFIMGAIAIAFAITLIISYKNCLNNKYDFIIVAINAIDKYKFLISQLVKRDFKSKYKRSILGMLWSFLNPLLTMIVQFLVFSTIFKADTRSYPVYLLSGVICFNFFKEATDMCLTSISGNANLINKVYIPKYIFPLSKTISSMVNLLISLVPLFAVSFVLGLGFHFSTILSFYFLICLIIFSLGIGLFLSSIMVFFRDTQFLWNVLTQIWVYATPIFYSAEIIPKKYRFVIRFNPLYHFIGNFRKCIMDGISPDPISYIYCLAFAIVSLGVGLFVFKKTQDKFTLYL